ncbi:MAG: inositol monophosphatase family protein [Chloroflexota bacterium]
MDPSSGHDWPLTGEVDVAIEAARAAGAVIRGARLDSGQVSAKGPADLVTEIDREAERTIALILAGRFPEYGLVGEEGTADQDGEGVRWIIDPLDGTLNFVNGHPIASVSIALERHGVIVLGVVYQPYTDELFVAARDQGAELDGRPIRVSTVDRLANAFVLTGLPYTVRDRPDVPLEAFVALARQARTVRIFGSAALDLCSVATGRADAYFEAGLKPWDVAAGRLIVELAGGRFEEVASGPDGTGPGWTLATNGRLHDEIRGLIQDPSDRRP